MDRRVSDVYMMYFNRYYYYKLIIINILFLLVHCDLNCCFVLTHKVVLYILLYIVYHNSVHLSGSYYAWACGSGHMQG